jgi:peptidoglycan hydrolase CwlO-like protein
MFFASVIVKPIDIKGYLRTQVEHAHREGEAAKSVRPGAVPMAGWAHSAVIPDRPRDYAAAFKAVPEHFGARYRKGTPFGLHLLLNVSPAWIREVGDLHDERNERNQRLYKAARDFAGGIPGLVATRMDLDEEGGGEVDVFLAPVFPRTSRLRKDGSRGLEIPEISVSKLDALWREQTSERIGYSGLQTLWAAYCAKHLDPRIQRGERKSETGREHLTVPKFKAACAYAEALVAEAETIMEQARREKAEVEEERRRLADEAQAIKARAQELERERNLLCAQIEMSEGAYEVAKADLEKTATKLGDRRRQLDEEAEHLTTARHELARTEARLRRDREELAEKKQRLKAEEERLDRERTEYATRIQAESQFMENLRTDLAKERTYLKKVRSDLQSAIGTVDRGQRELEIKEAEMTRDRADIDAEQKSIVQDREQLSRQSRAQAEYAKALETGLEVIVSGQVNSKEALKDQASLQPAMDQLVTFFDTVQEIGKITARAQRYENAYRHKLEELEKHSAKAIADEEHVRQQLDILTSALELIGHIQPQLSREDQKKVSEARIGLERVNVIRRPPPRKPDLGIEM